MSDIEVIKQWLQGVIGTLQYVQEVSRSAADDARKAKILLVLVFFLILFEAGHIVLYQLTRDRGKKS